MGEVPDASPRDLLAQDLFERRVSMLDGENGSQDVELSHHLIGWELRPEEGTELVQLLRRNPGSPRGSQIVEEHGGLPYTSGGARISIVG